jgi:hypothetical protein
VGETAEQQAYTRLLKGEVAVHNSERIHTTLTLRGILCFHHIGQCSVGSSDHRVAATLQAPVTVVNHPEGHHGFDTEDDTEHSCAIIAQTIAFYTNIWTTRHLMVNNVVFGVQTI